MKHGDISNTRGFVIGVRCEECLLMSKDNNIVDKALNKMFGKLKRATVNEEVLSLIKYIYWNTEMSVVLFVDKKNYSKELEDYLAEFPCNQIGVVLENISEVTMMLNTGLLTYFVTNSTLEKSLVNSTYAVTVEEFNTILKRQVKRFG